MVQPVDEGEFYWRPQPTTRFTQFLGWSDGSKENPRALRISRDYAPDGNFRPWCSPDPMRIRGSDCAWVPIALSSRVVGNDLPYRYRVQTSRSTSSIGILLHRNPVLFQDGVFSEALSRQSHRRRGYPCPTPGVGSTSVWNPRRIAVPKLRLAGERGRETRFASSGPPTHEANPHGSSHQGFAAILRSRLGT